jgi:hypothetical protein
MTLKVTNLNKIQSNQKSVKMVIFGPFGVGKTSLLKTLEELTLCLDFEAGLLSVQNWQGTDGSSPDVVSLKTWEEARDLACLICGPNPAKKDQIYSQRHYEYCTKKHSDLVEKIRNYKCIFIDSITVASRLCLEFAKNHPDVINTKTGKPDIRSAYGILATEMLAWVNQFQHLQQIDVVFVGGLDQKQDEFNRTVYAPQCEGSKIAAELPGILDEVITMVAIQGTRKFVCQTLNQDGYPAKDRSGKLNVLEEAHLGKLLKKIKGPSQSETELETEKTIKLFDENDIKNSIKQIADLSNNLTKKGE